MSEMKSSTGIEYRQVLGFPGYRVGNDGTVLSAWKSGRDKFGRITWDESDNYQPIIPQTVKGNYLMVWLRKDGKTFRRYVHRLVAEMFVGTCPVGMEVCHNDGTRTNNEYTNLRYGTRKENLADRELHGTSQRGERNPAATLTNKQANELKARRVAGESLKTLAALFNVRESTVSRIANGVRRA